VILDEFNGLVMVSGGERGALAQAVTQLAWGGLKFCVHLVLVGQTFNCQADAEKALESSIRS